MLFQLNDSIFELHTPQGAPNLEFVFFHGLYLGNFKDHDPYLSTWESGDGTCIWPQTWLVDEFPGARITFVSYRGKVGKLYRGSHDMYIVGENLAFDMMEANIGQTSNCPVILVGHCFGGLVLKQLCLQVNVKKGLTKAEGERAKLEMFLGNIKGIFYYGTPHYGNPMIDKITNIFKDPLLSYFKTLSTEGSRLNSDFDHLYGVYAEWRTHSLGESLPSESGLFKGVVAASEACARHGDFNLLATDHSSICKPKDTTDMRFYALTNLVKSVDSNFEDLSLYVHQCKGLPSYPADLEKRAREVQEKLKGVFFLGLVGMGGIGKTTLAKQVFNNISRQFKYTCFVDNVKGVESHRLEDRLLSTFHHNGKSIDKKIDCWQLKGKRTLIVMDDLDSRTQLKLLEPQSFGKSSHIIITIRDRGVLDSVGNKEIMSIYDVDFLEMDDAKKLFCQHAGIEHIEDVALETNNLKEKVEAVDEKCGGLPLTLEVMGSYLRDHVTNTSFWNETIDKLVTGQPVCGGRDDEVWASLRISYIALVQEEQEMFTEAATLFFEKPLDRALAAWSSAYGNSETRWENLVRRSLVRTVSFGYLNYQHKPENLVWVHEQLRGLAMSLKKGDLVYKQIKESKEIEDLLNQEKVKGEAKLLLVHHGYLRPWGNLPTIQVHQLAKLKRLKYLELLNCVLNGSGKNFPRELFILSLKAEDSTTRWQLPSINLKALNNLAVLEIKNCCIPEKALEALVNLHELRILSLRNLNLINKLRISSLNCFLSGVIRRLPESFGNLSRLKDLELVDLELEELPESLGHLSAFEHLTLTGVKCLELPKSFVELGALQSLTIHSDTLGALPERIGRLSSLRRLNLSGNRIGNLPSSIEQLSALQFLSISSNCLRGLPDRIGRLSSLRRLVIYGDHIENLPTSFGLLFALQYLTLYCLCLKKLPAGFGNLSSLKQLVLYTRSLASMPKGFGNLSSLEWLEIHSDRLEALPENFGRLNSLRRLDLSGLFDKLPNSFVKLSRVEDLKLDCHNLVTLPDGFGNLSSLKSLKIHSDRLEALPENFGRLNSLSSLKLSGLFDKLPNIFGKLSLLQYFTLDCHNLVTLPDGFGNLSSLQHLEIRMGRLESLPNSFGNLSSLRKFSIRAPCLKSFPESVKHLSSLRELEVCCDGHERMPDGFAHLSFFSHSLTLTGNPRVLPSGLGVLSSLRTLILWSPGSLKRLPEELGELSSLETLEIRSHLFGDNLLESLPRSLGCISSLKAVHLDHCRELRCIPSSWGNPSSLKQLTLPQGKGRQELKRSAVGESSSTTTDAEGMRIHIGYCDFLDESVMMDLGWLLDS